MQPSIRSLLLFLSFLLWHSAMVFGQFSSTWRQGEPGVISGFAGILIEDTDQDGRDEIITSAVTPWSFLAGYWYVLENDREDLHLEQSWFSNLDLRAVKKVDLVKKENGAGHYYVQALNPNLSYPYYEQLILQVFDFERKELLLEKQFDHISNWLIDDYDRNGKPDFILFSEDAKVKIYSFPELKLKTEFQGYDYFRFTPKLGNFDQSPDLEVFKTRWGSFSIQKFQDGKMVTLWEYTDWSYLGSIPDSDFLDIDRDGDLEVITILADTLRVFDILKQEQILAISLDDIDTTTHNDRFIQRIILFDIEQDGRPELIGMGLYGHLFILDAYSMQLISSFQNPYTATLYSPDSYSDLYIGDTNGDQIPELIWTGVFNTNAAPPSQFYLQELGGEQKYWVSNQRGSNQYDMQLGNFLGTERKQLIRAYSDWQPQSAEAGGTFLLDAETKEVLGQTTNSYILTDFVGFQMDEDPALEILVATNSFAWAIDLPDFEILDERLFEHTGSTLTRAYRNADIDLDGRPEAMVCLVTIGVQYYGSSYIMVFDEQLNRKWFVPHLDLDPFADNYAMEVGNIDDDPQLEIVVLRVGDFQGYTLVIVDGMTREVEEIPFGNYPLIGLTLYDNNQDGRQEIYLGGVNEILVMDAVSKSVQKDIQLTDQDHTSLPLIHNIKFFDFDADGKTEMIVTHQGKVKVLDVDGRSLFWESPFLAREVSPYNKLIVGEVAGIPRIIVGTEYFVEEFSFTGQLTSTASDRDRSDFPLFTLYPNPAQEQLYIDIPNAAQELDWAISDITGRQLAGGTLLSTAHPIELGKLPIGAYLLEVRHQGKPLGIQKFLITR